MLFIFVVHFHFLKFSFKGINCYLTRNSSPSSRSGWKPSSGRKSITSWEENSAVSFTLLLLGRRVEDIKTCWTDLKYRRWRRRKCLAIIWASQSLLIDLHTGVVGFLHLVDRRDLGVFSRLSGYRQRACWLIIGKLVVGGRSTGDCHSCRDSSSSCRRALPAPCRPFKTWCRL